MKAKVLLPCLSALWACGGGAAPVGATSPAATSASTPSSTSTTPSSAATTSSPSSPSAPATAAATDGADLLSQPAPKTKTVERPLPNTPFFVTVPTDAVLEKSGIDDKSMSADIMLEKGSSQRLSISPRSAIVFGPLPKELADLAGQKLPVVSSRGTADDYAIVYKPYPNMFTYGRVLNVGGKEMQCFIEGLTSTEDIPQYDAICRSIRAKK